MSGPYKLYGADFSLYSGKARCYLQKKGIPFVEILSTIKVYKKFIMPRTGVSYIPVVQTPEDEVFQDTTVIINELEERFPEPSVFPPTPQQKLVALLLEVYGDEWLVIPAMHYRWSYQEVNQPVVYQRFGSLVSPRMPKFIRARLGEKLGRRFK
ncbi:MAG: glutathione S-transferase, partial [Gammaproteobacteria bacterium]|nr:glutathione S-transferase [Gammaproteobacteria bacterium]